MEVPLVPVTAMSWMVGGVVGGVVGGTVGGTVGGVVGGTVGGVVGGTVGTGLTVSDTAEFEVSVLVPSPYVTMILPVIDACVDGRPILTVIVPLDSVPEMLTPAFVSVESAVMLV